MQLLRYTVYNSVVNAVLGIAPSYTESEVAQIISHSKNEPLVWQAIIMFLIDSGCRIGECLGLQWKNVDFENNRVKIDGSLNYNSKLGVFRGTTKNGEAREFRVSDDVMALLSVLRQHQQLSVQSEYVFTMPSNILPVHPQSPRRYFKKFGEKYGVNEFHPHKLRHIPNILMSKKDYEKFQAFPSEIEIYRGVSTNSNDNIKAFSWTTDKEKALWFANRFSRSTHGGYVYKAKIRKEHIYAYFTVRNESEVVVDPTFLENIQLVENVDVA